MPGLILLGWFGILFQEVFVAAPGPSLPLIAGLVAGIFFGPDLGLGAGVGVGLIADALSTLPLGTQALAAGIFGSLAGGLSETLKRTSWVAHALCLVLASVPYRLGLGLLVRLGGHPVIAFSTAEATRSLVMDLGFGMVFFGLCRNLARRRP